MERRNFLLTATAGLFMSQATGLFAAEAWVTELNTYMNSIKTAFAPFSETGPSGKKASGKFYLQKPGKMRFEYDQKDRAMVIADGTTIAILDPKSNSQNQKYPQNQTPVSMISKANVDLMSSPFIKKLEKNGNEALITMVDPKRPNIGTLIVRVDMASRTIKGWQSIDQSGGKTTISFPEFHEGVAMNAGWFNITAAQKQM